MHKQSKNSLNQYNPRALGNLYMVSLASTSQERMATPSELREVNVIKLVIQQSEVFNAYQKDQTRFVDSNEERAA